MDGKFAGTAFAYGQTSSGKTFTMNGSENDPGIIHRAVKDIFSQIQTVSSSMDVVKVDGFLDINNDLCWYLLISDI